MRNSVLGLWSLGYGDRVAKPGRPVVFLSCAGEGCARVSPGASQRLWHLLPQDGPSIWHSRPQSPTLPSGHTWHEPHAAFLGRSPAGSLCLPNAGSCAAFVPCGRLAGRVPSPLGQFLPQLISSLWPILGNEPTLADCLWGACQASLLPLLARAPFLWNPSWGAPSLVEFSWEPAGCFSH